ncbi:glutathione S-transferase LANCL1 [Bicyclus anynana]|uniref:Glutathione S-transferase LANCL1 n=1 Tax=Bicyclus anynana TaxID=110368 RepID=A0A6J1NNF9_BICAN|nr:glutathione S-transferase LANCL1 [Bicyclus anynana]
MAGKRYFENQFDDFSSNSTYDFFRQSEDGISEKFSTKLKNYKSEKLSNLVCKPGKEIFHHDGTVYTGSTGLAYYYLMSSLSKDEGCNENLLNALKYIDLNSLKGRRISFLCGDAGPLAIATVISFKLGISRPDTLPEYGTIAQSPLLWQWHEKVYLGAAHGVAGILYLLLLTRAYIDVKDIQDLIKPAVDWLLNQQFPSGNYPSSLGSSSGDKLVQWCHGAPGFVPLCLLAYQVFEQEKYLKIAIECGEVIWQRGLCTKGYSLCHGVSGNAYAFLQLYQATKKKLYIHRACCFMEWCILEHPGTEQHPPDRPASLFEGVIGPICLAEAIMHPLQSKFPAFCL